MVPKLYQASKRQRRVTKCLSRTACDGSDGFIQSLESRVLFTAVVVNTATDTSHAASLISLRDAITKANASTTPTTITFDPSIFAAAKSITLTSPLRLTNRSAATTIVGTTAGLTLTGSYLALANAFEIDSGVTVTISHLSILKEGILNAGSLTVAHILITGVADTGNYYGGAIANKGTMVVTNATFSNNTIGSSGGGIYNTGKMTLTNVTISGNDARNDNGGGIYNTGTATLANVTIANNIGGGFDNQGGTALLSNVTVSGNKARYNGGGVYVGGGTVTLANTIIAGNSLTGSGRGPDVYGSFRSLGHNLIGKADAGTGFNTADFTGTIAKPLDAKLSLLGHNGGTMQTMLPLVGSPAVDRGSNTLVPVGITRDQRGMARVVASIVDIGSIEVQPLALTAPVGLRASAGSFASYVHVTWSAVTNSTSYEVWRGTANRSNLAVRIAANVSGLVFDDKTAIVGTTYFYWIKAKNVGGTSAFSMSASGYAFAPVTVAQLIQIMPTVPKVDATRYVPALNNAMQKFDVRNPKRIAAFIAQLAVESIQLTHWTEKYTLAANYQLRGVNRPPHTATSKQDYFNYWYGDRKDLGNTQPGDGYAFRGRGPIQLTGRSNYVAAAAGIGVDIVANPDLVSDNLHPSVGFLVAAWFFRSKGLNVVADSVNPKSSTSISDTNQSITRGINGGTNGLSERLAFYRIALNVLGA